MKGEVYMHEESGGRGGNRESWMYILAVLHWVLCGNTVYDVCQCFSACFSISLSPHEFVNVTR